MKTLLFEPPGTLITGMPAAEYHGTAAASSHLLWTLATRSPGHARYAILHPEARAPTAAMRLGTAAHCAILEPDQFARRYRLAPEFSGRGSVQARRESAAACEADGCEPISEADAALVRAMAESVHASPLAKALLADGRAELSGFWIDDETGETCRMRPDFVPDGQAVIVDLKTAASAAPDDFMRAAARFGYHLSAAMYCDGWQAITGERPDYVFCVVESAPPHAVAWYRLDRQFMLAGWRLFVNALQVWSDCIAADVWPYYPADIRALSAPKFLLRNALGTLDHE